MVSEFVGAFLPHLLNGLALGLLFALVALGFMLILGVMGVINLAHGSFFTLGAYGALTFLTPEGGLDLPFLAGYFALPAIPRYVVALVLAPVAVGLWGMLLEVCMRRTYGKDPLYGLLLTFGAAMVIEELIRITWGAADHYLPVPREIRGGFLIGDLIYSKYRVYATLVSVAMIGLLWFFIERTPYGAIIRAGSHDGEMVQALGINLRRLRLFVFGFGTALAAIAGIVMAPLWGLRPTLGVDAVIPAFVIVALGGVGSFWGPVLAGLLIGMAIGLTAAFFTDWSLLSMYILVFAVLTFRGRGLLGKASVLEH